MNLSEIKALVEKYESQSYYQGYEHSVQIINTKRTLGKCSVYLRSKRVVVSISKYHIEQDSRDAVLDTVLHEIAHFIAGLHNNHNSVWKAVCREIGAEPSATAKSNIDPKYVLIHKNDLRIIARAHSARKKWVKNAHTFRLRNEEIGNLFALKYEIYKKYIKKQPEKLRELFAF